MKNASIVSECRLCKSSNLSEPKINLGSTPLANEFLSEKTEQVHYPLIIICCNDCGHYQLNISVDPEILFKNYSYVAGTSLVNVEHFKQYALHVTDKLYLKPDSKILDIASNDGTLLKQFKNIGMNTLGIDPAENLAAIANAQGINTIPEFFTEEYSKKIELLYGKFDLITANNVFAHVPDLKDFALGVKNLLTYNGTFSFEVSYFDDVCEKNLFDTIYHEHSSYHTITPLISFFNSIDLEIFDVEQINNHGGSIRVFVCFKDSTSHHASIIKNLILKEKNIEQKVINLQEKIKNLGDQLKDKLFALKSQNKSIAIYGMPAKATTLMYALDIDESLIDFAVEDAVLKQNTFSPGKHIPIYHPDEIYKRNPDIILILGWNFAESIINNHNDFKGNWIIPIPEMKEIKNDK